MPAIPHGVDVLVAERDLNEIAGGGSRSFRHNLYADGRLTAGDAMSLTSRRDGSVPGPVPPRTRRVRSRRWIAAVLIRSWQSSRSWSGDRSDWGADHWWSTRPAESRSSATMTRRGACWFRFRLGIPDSSACLIWSMTPTAAAKAESSYIRASLSGWQCRLDRSPAARTVLRGLPGQRGAGLEHGLQACQDGRPAGGNALQDVASRSEVALDDG
jgi:hypothetical protein